MTKFIPIQIPRQTIGYIAVTTYIPIPYTYDDIR